MPAHAFVRLMGFTRYNALLAASASFSGISFLPAKPKPFIATINVTENCQLRCRVCQYWRTSKNNGISTARAMSLISELAQEQFRHLRILGGEPLLREDLFDMLSVPSIQSFAKIIVGSNGMLLGRLSEKIINSPITNLTVSLDGIGPTHDAMRGVPGCFDTVIGGLGKIRGKRIKIASLGSSLLARDIEELLDLCVGNGYDFDICPLNPTLPFSVSGGGMEDLVPSESDVDRIVNAMLRRGMVTNRLAVGYRQYLLTGQRPPGRSVLAYLHMIIRADGAVSLGCYDGRPIGSVVTDSIHDILSSNAAAAEATEMFLRKSEKCFCGWQIDEAYRHPLEHFGYIRRRLEKRQ